MKGMGGTAFHFKTSNSCGSVVERLILDQKVIGSNPASIQSILIHRNGLGLGSDIKLSSFKRKRLRSSVVECLIPKLEVIGSNPTIANFCPFSGAWTQSPSL